MGCSLAHDPSYDLLELAGLNPSVLVFVDGHQHLPGVLISDAPLVTHIAENVTDDHLEFFLVQPSVLVLVVLLENSCNRLVNLLFTHSLL
jgi:hypothetical protein